MSRFIENQNHTINKRTGEASKYFDKIGYDSVILKGQVNALYYPHPERGNSGDIDIWIIGKRSEPIDYVVQHSAISRVQFLHVDFHLFDDAEVEVNFAPGILLNYFADKNFRKSLSIILMLV